MYTFLDIPIQTTCLAHLNLFDVNYPNDTTRKILTIKFLVTLISFIYSSFISFRSKYFPCYFGILKFAVHICPL